MFNQRRFKPELQNFHEEGHVATVRYCLNLADAWECSSLPYGFAVLITRFRNWKLWEC